MKKIYLMIASVIAIGASAQATLDTLPASFHTGPGVFGTFTQLRLPNGTATDKFVRGIYHIPSSEIGATSMVSGESILKIGFHTLDSVSGAKNLQVDSTVTGTITIYAQNTTDATFSKSGNWSAIYPTMTAIYTGPFNIFKDSVAEYMFTCNTPLIYNGGGLYIAYDYTRDASSKISTTPASWDANNLISASCFASRLTTAAPAALPAGGSAFRPATRIVHDFASKVNTVKDNNSFAIYPNPNNGVFSVSVKGEPITALSVLDAVGKVVYTKDASTISESIDISKLSAGIYFLKVSQNGKTKVMTFTKN
jgi:Secretion system C-terminal sorting domain